MPQSLKIKRIESATQLPRDWNNLTQNYFQSLAFLSYVEQYNPCSQHYYIAYQGKELVATAVVYKLKKRAGLLFEAIKVIGLPFSIATPGVMGDFAHQQVLVHHITKKEKNILYCPVSNISFDLPNLIHLDDFPNLTLDHDYSSFDEYLSAMRAPYRRRLQQAQKKFTSIKKSISPCLSFTQNHYQQYLDVQKKHQKNVLETLSFDFFKNLPNCFLLSSYHLKEQLIAWSICMHGTDTFFFFFGGMDYPNLKKHDAFLNNLINITEEGIKHRYQKIDFGPSAEQSKMRVGAKLIPNKRFLYHRWFWVRWLIKLKINKLNYNPSPFPNMRVFKD